MEISENEREKEGAHSDPLSSQMEGARVFAVDGTVMVSPVVYANMVGNRISSLTIFGAVQVAITCGNMKMNSLFRS